jgi:hypothetical protein
MTTSPPEIVQTTTNCRLAQNQVLVGEMRRNKSGVGWIQSSFSTVVIPLYFVENRARI